MKATFVLALAALAMLGRTATSQTIYQGPWCAIVMIGEGSVAERCDMRSFQMCQARDPRSGRQPLHPESALRRGRTEAQQESSACNSGGQGHIACQCPRRRGERVEIFVMRIGLLLPVLAVASIGSAAPSLAYSEGPWCAPQTGGALYREQLRDDVRTSNAAPEHFRDSAAHGAPKILRYIPSPAPVRRKAKRAREPVATMH